MTNSCHLRWSLGSALHAGNIRPPRLIQLQHICHVCQKTPLETPMEVNSKKLLFCINSRERHKDASIEVLCFLVSLSKCYHKAIEENYYLYNAEAVVIIALFVGFHEVKVLLHSIPLATRDKGVICLGHGHSSKTPCPLFHVRATTNNPTRSTMTAARRRR